MDNRDSRLREIGAFTVEGDFAADGHGHPAIQPASFGTGSEDLRLRARVPPVMVFAPVEPVIDSADDSAEASTFWKLVTLAESLLV